MLIEKESCQYLTWLSDMRTTPLYPMVEYYKLALPLGVPFMGIIEWLVKLQLNKKDILLLDKVITWSDTYFKSHF